MSVSQLTKPVVKLDATSDVLTGSHQIMWIAWVCAGAAGTERLHLTDVDGHTVVDDYATAGNYVQYYPIFGPVTNLTLTVRGGGYVLVYRHKRLPIFWNA